MKRLPILFSGPLVVALLAGKKTVTRRLVVPQPAPEFVRAEVVGPWVHFYDEPGPPNERGNREGKTFTVRCRYGAAGQPLWVRERARVIDRSDADARAERIRVRYEADGAESATLPYPARLTWDPVLGKCIPMGCYREASRLDLTNTGVRIERLQEITEEDAIAEGVAPFFERFSCIGRDQRLTTGELAADAPHRASFAVLWDELNGDRATWKSNPFVFRVGVARSSAPPTTEERRMMRHALGLDRAKVAYRNRYVAPDGGEVVTMLESLVARGLMERGAARYYYLTQAGIEAVTLPREREQPEMASAGGAP